MKKVIGFCNLHDNPSLGALTAKRPIGAVSFLGRYALMDFALSNFSNSDINKMYVLVESRQAAIQRHIGSGQAWIKNTKTGSLTLQLNEKLVGNSRFNTDLANINETMSIDELDFDYAVISNVCFLCSMDLRPIIKAHEESKNDITIVYSHQKNVIRDFPDCDIIDCALDGNIVSISKGNDKDSANVAIGTYIISRKALLKMLSDVKKVSALYSFRQMTKYYFDKKLLKVGGFEFDGFVLPVLSLEQYVSSSFSLLTYKNRLKFYNPEWPIYTTTHNTPPTLYGPEAEVSNSFIANGSVIKGKVTNSIISRAVKVDEGAVIDNSIIFTSTEVGKNASLKYVLSDKSVVISNNTKLKGNQLEIIYIKGGTKI